MKLNSFEDLFKFKDTETAILIGSGSSVNDLTESEWSKIVQLDFWR